MDIRDHPCDNIIKNPHDHIITPKTSHSDRTLPLPSPTHGYKKPVDKPVHNLWKSYGTGSGNPVYTVVYKERSWTLLTIHCLHPLFNGFSILEGILIHHLHIFHKHLFYIPLFFFRFTLSTLSTPHHQHHIFLLFIR